MPVLQEHDNDEDDLGVPKDEVYISHSSDIDDADETDEVSEDSQQFVMFSSRDQPQDRGARSSQLRMAPTVIGRLESQRCESVGGNKSA